MMAKTFRKQSLLRAMVDSFAWGNMKKRFDRKTPRSQNISIARQPVKDERASRRNGDSIRESMKVERPSSFKYGFFLSPLIPWKGDQRDAEQEAKEDRLNDKYVRG